MKWFRRLIACLLAVQLAGVGTAVGAQPVLIGAAEVAAAEAGAADARGVEMRQRLLAALERDDVAAALQARGVSREAARERVAALTDAEAATLAATIDSAPAGGDIVGALLFVFVLLLVTDILGLTKVFPFTRSVR